MKALGLALLLANLLFLVWSQWLGSNEPQATAPPPQPGARKLVLASEASAVESGAPQVPAPAENEEPYGPLEVGPNVNDRPRRTPAASEPAQTTELIAGMKRCLSIGPFRDLAEATQGSTALRSAGHDPRTRVAEGEVWAGLWVYLGDLPSREEAQRAVTLLKQRGIRDAYIMPAADSTADISLGIFSEPARAQRRAEEVRALGFTPTVADRTRTGTVYWVDVDLEPTDGFIDPSTLPSEEGKISRLQVDACPAAQAG